MKTKMTFWSILFLCLMITGIRKGNGGELPQNNSKEPDKVYLVVSPELKNLATAWKDAYKQAHPETRIIVEAGSKWEIPEPGRLYLSEESELEGRNFWKMSVGHEIIVAVANKSNPFLDKIMTKGITPVLALDLMNPQVGWNLFPDDNSRNAAQGYITGDPSILSGLADYLQQDISVLTPLKKVGRGEVPEKVKGDIYSFGFCRLSEVTDLSGDSFPGQLTVLPIDRNGNGRVDVFENVYSGPDALIRGVWTGRYPRQLTSGIYAVATEKPENHAMLDFLTWISQDGQNVLAFNGLCKIPGRESAENMILIGETEEPDTAGTGLTAIAKIFAGILILLVILVAGGILFYRRKTTDKIDAEDLKMTPVFDEDSVLAPAGLFYDKTHTWVFMEKDGRVKVGIDDFMQHVTGELSQVKMKQAGEKVVKGEKLISIVREGKQLDLYSPVTGIIKRKNGRLEKEPSLLMAEPYADGWAYEIEPANWLREIRYLFMAGKYREWLDDEFVRLKDFLAVSANRNSGVYEHVVLQDGGELTDHVLSELGPDIWDDFQTRFLDSSR